MERKIRAYKSYFTDFITSISEAEARKVFQAKKLKIEYYAEK